MKKLIIIAVSLLLVLTIASCDINIYIENSDGKESGSAVTVTVSESTPVQGGSTDTEAVTEEVNNTDNAKKDTLSVENVNNGVLKEAALKSMNVPVNIKYLGTEAISEENNAKNITATVVLYYLDGDVVNWTTENDLIYVITSGNNRLVVIDSKNMNPVYNVPLPATPAEMNIIGDEIYISFPDLSRIDVFSRSDCTKESSLYFEHEVSSFCLDGDYVYYSEHDQHCKVYRKNLVTNTLVTVENESNDYFYKPKLYLNKEDGILYIGETGISGSALYYYNANTLTQKSVFKKSNYGIMNHTREIFHVGDDIFWGGYRLSDTNANEIIGKYGTESYGSVVFASEEIVSTFNGLFLTDTYECVIDYFDAGFDFEYVLVTESNHVFFRKRSLERNVIVGINFEFEEEEEPEDNTVIVEVHIAPSENKQLI